MKLGNLDIKDIYVGSTPAAQVYFGDVKVWPEEQPAPVQVNAVRFQNIGNTTGVVWLVRNESEALSDLADWEYSSDGSGWTAWDKTFKELSVDVGDSLYVRAGETGQSRLASSDGFTRANRILPLNSSFKASGPLSSLLSKSGTIPAGPTEYQFASLFLQGLALVDASELELPSTAAQYGFSRTFGITGLSAAPVLPATTLSSSCYFFMFGQCTSLSTPPALPATTLANQCYNSMFYGCTSLTAGPSLEAITLAEYCYQYMFYGCTSLSTPPALPATTLASNCYQYMFQSCTSLTSTGNLKTYSMYPTDCYSYMFANDTTLISAIFPTAWDSDLTAIFANDIGGASTMFDGCDASQVWVTYVNGSDWLSSFLPKAEEVEGVKFTNIDQYGGTAEVTLVDNGASNAGGSCDLVYSTDGINWSSYTVGDTIYLYNQYDYVIFKAASTYNSGIQSVSESEYYNFSITPNNILVEGDLTYLFTDDPGNGYMSRDYQFAKLFYQCDFVAEYNGTYSSLKMPEEHTWASVGYSYVFAETFQAATLARITIPVDSQGWTNGWSAYNAYYYWVYQIDDDNQGGLMQLPSYFSTNYGDSYIPNGWSYEQIS